MEDPRLIKESLGFSSEIFRHIFKTAFFPLVKEWRRKITQEVELSNDERKALVIAYNELYHGFIRAYDSVKIDPPEWFLKEFDRDV